ATNVFADDRAARQDSDVLEHGLAAITEARSLDNQNIQHTTQLVQHEGSQRFAVDVYSDDHQVTATNLDQLLQDGNDVLSGADLLFVDQDIRLIDNRFHRVGSGDKIGADVAAIKLHTFDVLGLEFQTTALFNRDHAVLTDLVHDFGDQVTDLAVLCG